MQVDENQEVLWKLGHANLAAEIRPLLRPDAPLTVLYWIMNLAIMMVIAWRIFTPGQALLTGFSHVCVGMFAAWLLLVPLHEAIHAVAYRLVGARNVTIRYEWRRMTAMCTADGHVVGALPYVAVCMAPLAVLNSALTALVVVTSGTLQLVALGGLLLHTGACSGDIALARFTFSHRRRGVLTWDDVAARTTWFVAQR